VHTSSFLNLIGNTPLVELKKIAQGSARYFAKLEMLNPTYSIKDRLVLHIVNDAEQKGLLMPGMTLIEASSGNTGTSLAMLGALKQYPVIITTPAKTSAEKIAFMRAYGADVRISPVSAKKDDPAHYVTVAHALHQANPRSFLLNQYNNPANIEAHYTTTGPEIWDQTQGKIDYLIACSSSGGTLTGIGRYLKQKNPAIKIIMPDPVGSVYYDYFKTGKINPAHIKPYQLEGVGKDYICGCMDFSIIDDVIQLTDEDAFDAVKKLALCEGIFAGGSSGAALHVAHVIANQVKTPVNIVIIFPDSGLKYLSKNL
jgi:cystathionine beta-synthase